MPCFPWFGWRKKKGNFSLPVTPTESEESTEKKRDGAKRHSKWCFWRKKNKTKSAAITESSSETPQKTSQAVSLKLSGGCSPSLTRKTSKKTSTSQSVPVSETDHTEACLSTDLGRSDLAAVRTEKAENKIPAVSDTMREEIRKDISVLTEDIRELFLSYCMDEVIDLIDPEAFSLIKTMLEDNTSWLTPAPHKEKMKSPTTTLIPKTDKRLPDCWLPNLGMTCFVNASLQFLFTAETFCRELSHLLDNSPRGQEDTFLKCFVELSELRNGSEAKWGIDRNALLLALISSASDINPEFTIDKQSDAHEFLCHCLTQIEDSGKRLGWQEDVDPVGSNFMFKMRTSRTCSSCGTLQNDREELFNHLSVPLTHNSLDQCLDDLINNPTELESKCKTCEGESASSRCTFSTLPRFLIVQLHRFKVSKNYKVVKLKTPVDINPELQINCDPESDTAGIENSTAEVRETGRNDEVGGSSSTFRLISVISHVGDAVTCGHYLTDCLSHDPPQWMTCDDELVTPSTEEKVLKRRSTNAYLLLFERVSTG